MNFGDEILRTNSKIHYFGPRKNLSFIRARSEFLGRNNWLQNVHRMEDDTQTSKTNSKIPPYRKTTTRTPSQKTGERRER
jgi:hypothetical protein